MNSYTIVRLPTTARRACLLAFGAVLAFSASHVRAQYADWNANPPKILQNERSGSTDIWSAGSGRQYPNGYAFAALKADGSVVTWGANWAGGDSAAVAASLSSNVRAVYSTDSAFAALKTDGSVVIWGNFGAGGDSTAVASSLSSGVTAVYSNSNAFAALKNDGSVVTWGNPSTGGNFSSVSASLNSGVTAVYSNKLAFAALKADGSVVTWGDANSGGNSTAVASSLSSNVTALYSTQRAFAALKADGSVVTWGDIGYGGDSTAVASSLSSNVTAVYSLGRGFAALKTDGSLVIWGAPNVRNYSQAVASSLSSGVTALHSNYYAVAALKADGSVVTWGDANYGGDTQAVASRLSTGVAAVYSTGYAFAALKVDGSVVTWGSSSHGGASQAVASSLSSNVTAVYSNGWAFAALKSDGSIVTWGDSTLGGDSTAVAASLSSNVTAVYSTGYAFAALKSDGSVVTWGNAITGGDSTSVASSLSSGVTAVQSVSYFQYGPSLVTSAVNITSGSATLLGEVVSEGLSPVTSRGFVYALATVTDPEIGDAGVTQVTDNGSGLGSYSALLSGLTPNTAYVFRAYVVNGESTNYGALENFSTNLPPVIISDGGNTNVSLSVAENSTSVSTVSATDADPGQTITYSLSGADAARFAIGATSGVLTFAAAPDYEAPADANADNVYTVIVRATDNGNTPKSATQTLSVTVTNESDSGILAVEQPAGTSLANGGTANFGSVTIGQTNELTFTLRSQGEVSLLMPSGAVISGAAASEYSLIGTVPTSLATDGSATFTVRFRPTTSGNHAATLSIPTNDTRPGRSPYTISLSGIGSATQAIATYANAASQVLGGWVNNGNFTIGSAGSTWPSAESPDKVVDANTDSKFLTFRNNNAGVILKPTNSNLVFNRLSLWTANDSPDRDPASYIIYGSTSNLTGSAGTNIPISSLTAIASGNVTLQNARRTGPTVIQFANSVAYTSYVVVFPTVRNSSEPLTQISEIQLSQGTNPPLAVAMADARGGQLQEDVFAFGAIGTHWPDFESPDHAIDGNVDTKFLITRSTNAGLLASPQAGAARVNTLTFWTANDSPERDPATYLVFGFTNRITQTSGTLPLNATLLAEGTLTLPANRKAGPVQVSFNNSTAYASYLVVFPTVKNSPSTSITQISELQFSYNGTPDFSIPSPVLSLNENLGAQSNAAFVTGITAGLGDVGQTVSFACSNDNIALFSAQPAISAEGTLTLTTAPNAYGNATVSVVANDNFGRSSAPQTFRIEVAIVPLISPSASSLGDFSNVSGSQSFTVNGRGLAGPITLTAPAGFEISTDNSTFSSSLSVNNPGTIQNVYRGAFGNYTSASGNIWVSGSGTEFPNEGAFAALEADGSVVTWGFPAYGGDSTSVASSLGSGVTAVYSNPYAFAALKTDGSIVTWGDSTSGGDSTAVASSLGSGVTAVYSNAWAFAALKADGSVVTWGFPAYGGDSTAVASSLRSNVTAVYSTQTAFAALKTDGSVVTWGRAIHGGDSLAVASSLSSNVTAVYSSRSAFAALKADGSVVTWGGDGGDSTAVASSLSSNVTAVYSNQTAFAALKADGSVVTWGIASDGGDSSSVASSMTSNVTAVYSTRRAFAALKSNGSVVTWGSASYGGNSTAVASSLSSEVTAVYSTERAFAALKADGSVITWGDYNDGGDSTSVASSLSSRVTAVYSTRSAFAALKADGSIVTWGNSNEGGDSAAVASSLSSGVTAVYSTLISFAALKADGSVVTWGSANYGGSGGPTNIGVGVPIPATIYTRISSTAPVGSVSGNITLTSPGVQTQTVALSGTVARFISASANSLGNFSTEAGTASGSQSFTVDGGLLAGPITLTAPAGFEISTDNSTFSSSLNVNNPGTIQSVYRGAFGNYTSASGNVWTGGSGTEFPNNYAFAALKPDGSVVTWGSAWAGGDSTAVTSSISSNVKAVYSNAYAFAALKADGSVVTWGEAQLGGDSTAVASLLSSNVTTVYSNQNAFAALKADGSVVTWGDTGYGGDSTAVASSLSSNVTAVYSNQNAFAALKADGSVVTWGDAFGGGDSTSVASSLSSNVTAVYSTASAFAVLKADGSVVTWGGASDGGDSAAVASSLSSNVTAVYSNQDAFAALKTDGSVVTWGTARDGGDSTSVASSLTSNVTAVYPTKRAFAALKSNGSVVTWGSASYGGNSTSVASSLNSNITAVYSTERAFAALKADGSVITWGDASYGGDSMSVAGSLSSNVTAVYSNKYAFAALKADGSVITWGNATNGGNSAAVASSLSSGVTAVYSNQLAFAALKTDASVVTWGDASNGGSGGPANIAGPATIYTRISSTAPGGSVSGNITLTSPGAQTQTVALSGTVTEGPTYTHQELWRFANFGSYSSDASAADSADPDGDGLSNLMEYALGTGPNSSGVMPALLALNGASLEYTYTRSTAAKDNGVTYQIEWSDTLEVGNWSTQTVTEQITSTQGALETVKASIPKGSTGKRFLRLKVQAVSGN
jgi:alpha-tubulin suppressor-like RCC1 family protein